MKKRKIIMEQTFLLSFLMLTITGLEGIYSHWNGDPISFSWYLPASLLLMSFLCSLPTLLLLSEKNMTKKEWGLRIACHCLITYALVMGAGYLFHWYVSLTYFLVTTVAYFIIYVLVWVFTLFLEKYDEKLINEALKNIRDED